MNVNKNLCSLFRGIIFSRKIATLIHLSTLIREPGRLEARGWIIFGDAEPRLNLVKT
jgi:hypothetical protein